MLRALLLVLLSADVSGPLAEYLHAPAGSPEEAAAVEKIRVAYAEDPLAVEEAVRSFSGFPPAEPGLRRGSGRPSSSPTGRGAPPRPSPAGSRPSRRSTAC